MKTIRNHELLEDIITACAPRIGRESACNAMRALCRVYGGQNLLIPQNKPDGRSAGKILVVLEEEVGDADANVIFEKLVAFYGGCLIYIPLERSGFKRDIAKEIYAGLHNGISASDFCRKYNIANTQVYRLWRAGQRIFIDETSPRLFK